MNSAQSCMQEQCKSLTRFAAGILQDLQGILLRTYIRCCYGNQFLHPHAIIKFSYTIITFRQCHKLRIAKVQKCYVVLWQLLYYAHVHLHCILLSIFFRNSPSEQDAWLVFILSDYLNNKNSLQVLQ